MPSTFAITSLCVCVCAILHVNGLIWHVTVVEAKDIYCGSHCQPSTFTTHVKVGILVVRIV